MDNTFIIIIIFGYCLPTIIAWRRDHHYKWVIGAINLVFGFTGLGYLAAFAWAVWPKQTALFDIFANDPTTNSSDAGQKIYRQMGENIKAFTVASDLNKSELEFVNNPLDALKKLAEFRDAGVISETEFQSKKAELLARL